MSPKQLGSPSQTTAGTALSTPCHCTPDKPNNRGEANHQNLFDHPRSTRRNPRGDFVALHVADGLIDPRKVILRTKKELLDWERQKARAQPEGKDQTEVIGKQVNSRDRRKRYANVSGTDDDF